MAAHPVQNRFPCTLPCSQTILKQPWQPSIAIQKYQSLFNIIGFNWGFNQFNVKRKIQLNIFAIPLFRMHFTGLIHHNMQKCKNAVENSIDGTKTYVTRDVFLQKLFYTPSLDFFRFIPFLLYSLF